MITDTNLLFECPKRLLQAIPYSEYKKGYQTGVQMDHWFQDSRGNWFCSYCGSLLPEQFLHKMEVVVDRFEDLLCQVQYPKFTEDLIVDCGASLEQYVCKVFHMGDWLSKFCDSDMLEILTGRINQLIRISNWKRKEIKRWQLL